MRELRSVSSKLAQSRSIDLICRVLVLCGVTACTVFIGVSDVAGMGSDLNVSQNQTSRAQTVRFSPTDKLLPPANRFALIVGVQNYYPGEISPLEGSNNDAKSFRDSLIQFAGFPQENITVLASDQGSDFLPTQVNILTQLVYLVRKMPQEGLLLIAFSGHGLERNGEIFLLPQDARNIGSFAVLEGSSITLTQLKKIIYEIKRVKQIMILLDACRDDPDGSKAIGDNLLTPSYASHFNFDEVNSGVEAFAVLFATAVNRRAYVDPKLKQGYFSIAFAEALKGGEGGKALNDQGKVTLETLTNYIQETVSRRVLIAKGKEQRPFANIEGFRANKLILSIAPGVETVKEEPILTSALVSFHTNDDDKDADSAVMVDLRSSSGPTNAGPATRELNDVAVLPAMSGLFPDGSNQGPFQMKLTGTTKKSRFKYGLCLIWFYPNGHDTWRFNMSLELSFSDGTKETKNWDGLSIDQDLKLLRLSF
jgi:hypothetical protein